jgi:phosphoribosylglycinamide formyltransferase-1
MPKKIKVAVLISGRGSNLENLINAAKDKNFPAEITLVISNKADAYGLEIAKKNSIENLFIDHKKFTERTDFDAKLDEIIINRNCQIICLAGFMRILGADFVNKWHNKIINIHPSLLPAFKGANAVEEAINSGVKYSGCTVHYVSPEIDSGPIIKQAIVEVSPDDDKESLALKILKEEHKLYPEALEIICNVKSHL